MKHFRLLSNVLIALSLAAVTVRAQVAGQLYVTSYDDQADKVFFCHGERQNTVTTAFGMANLLYTTHQDLFVDSIVFLGSIGSFRDLPVNPRFNVAQVFYGAGPEYAPARPGTDTLIVRAYYGDFHSDGVIVYHAVESPVIGMYGYEQTTIHLTADISFGNTQQLIVTDTMHDILNAGLALHVGDTAVRKGLNNSVRLRACGDVTIDSVTEVGDFSEFVFRSLPTAPIAMHDGDSLTIEYDLHPNIVGRNQHYLVFHTSAGAPLVWSFEYKVLPNAAVEQPGTTSFVVRLSPNPVVSTKAGLELRSADEEVVAVDVVDALGRIVAPQSRVGIGIDPVVFPLEVAALTDGMYCVRIQGSRSTAVITMLVKR